jgi:RNA polymerase sigma-70 factor (TIGR02943 family)
VREAKISTQDPSAAAAWLGDHGDTLYRYALRRVRDPDVAEDLVQDTLLAALAARNSFAGGSSERTWLIGILKHKLVDHLRKSIRRQPSGELESEDRLDPFDKNGHWKVRVRRWQCDPRETAENAEFQKVLASCLSKLPPRTAQVFWLHEAESMSSKDLCKELELSPTNLWTMLHRARVGLQRCLSANWFESDNR